MNLNHVIKRRTELIESDTQRMFELMSMNYENYQKVNFETDLLEKDGVLIIYDENLVLQGFSTYKLIETEFENQQICAIYSGDTILNQQLWGSFASFKAFGFLLQTILTQHSGLLYWFLISKGHRTYLFLPLFFHRFYPNFRESTPDFESG